MQEVAPHPHPTPDFNLATVCTERRPVQMAQSHRDGGPCVREAERTREIKSEPEQC